MPKSPVKYVKVPIDEALAVRNNFLEPASTAFKKVFLEETLPKPKNAFLASYDGRTVSGKEYNLVGIAKRDSSVEVSLVFFERLWHREFPPVRFAVYMGLKRGGKNIKFTPPTLLQRLLGISVECDTYDFFSATLTHIANPSAPIVIEVRDNRVGDLATLLERRIVEEITTSLSDSEAGTRLYN